MTLETFHIETCWPSVGGVVAGQVGCGVVVRVGFLVVELKLGVALLDVQEEGSGCSASTTSRTGARRVKRLAPDQRGFPNQDWVLRC